MSGFTHYHSGDWSARPHCGWGTSTASCAAGATRQRSWRSWYGRWRWGRRLDDISQLWWQGANDVTLRDTWIVSWLGVCRQPCVCQKSRQSWFLFRADSSYQIIMNCKTFIWYRKILPTFFTYLPWNSEASIFLTYLSTINALLYIIFCPHL